MAWLLKIVIEKNYEVNNKMMNDVISNSKEREEKLYDELSKCREVNNKAIEVIGSYAGKIDSIQSDVKEIKTDLTTIKAKID